MKRWTALFIFLAVVIASSVGCSHTITDAEYSKTPDELLEIAAQDFPMFEIAHPGELSTYTAPSDSNATEQDAELILKYKSAPFYMNVQYDRIYPKDSTPTEWNLYSDFEPGQMGITFTGELDQKAISFIEAFVAEHPDGEYIYWSSTSKDDGKKLEVELVERDGSFYSMKEDEVHEVYLYAPKSETWVKR